MLQWSFIAVASHDQTCRGDYHEGCNLGWIRNALPIMVGWHWRHETNFPSDRSVWYMMRRGAFDATSETVDEGTSDVGGPLRPLMWSLNGLNSSFSTSTLSILKWSICCTNVQQSSVIPQEYPLTSSSSEASTEQFDCNYSSPIGISRKNFKKEFSRCDLINNPMPPLGNGSQNLGGIVEPG